MPILSWPKVQYEPLDMTSGTEIIDWGIKTVGIPQFWSQTMGEGINILVLDTGVAYNHTDLRDAIKDMKDFTNSPSGPMDVHGHGTHVCGTIAARKNSSGVVGVAPMSNLYVGKVMGDNGKGTDQNVADGIRWAIELGNIHIISMSLGSPTPSPLIQAAVKEAAAKGIFIIAAAGNEGPRLDTMGYPAKWPEVISVGAIDRRLNVADFSSRSASSDDVLDIMAPGDNILSTWPPNTFQRLSGTSMACPLVSGVVALMLSKHMKYGSETPIVGVKDLRDHLRKAAIDLGPSGWDENYGSGLIDPQKLLGNSTPLPNPMTTTTQPPVLNKPVELTMSDLSVTGYNKLKSFLGDRSIADFTDSLGRRITVSL